MTELTELKLLGAYFGFFLVLGIGFVLSIPILIWKETRQSKKLLEQLLAQQQQTNKLMQSWPSAQIHPAKSHKPEQ